MHLLMKAALAQLLKALAELWELGRDKRMDHIHETYAPILAKLQAIQAAQEHESANLDAAYLLSQTQCERTLH